MSTPAATRSYFSHSCGATWSLEGEVPEARCPSCHTWIRRISEDNIGWVPPRLSEAEEQHGGECSPDEPLQQPEPSHDTSLLRRYEAVIKVNRDDEPKKRATDIAEGLGYAVALLQDEYGWSADRIEAVLEGVIDDARDSEEQRNG